jgi:hypothetical protein
VIILKFIYKRYKEGEHISLVIYIHEDLNEGAPGIWSRTSYFDTSSKEERG